MNARDSRRQFLKTSAAAAAAAGAVPYFFSGAKTAADESKAKNDRPRIGAIGVGSMGRGDSSAAARFGDILAVCDVDENHAKAAAAADNIGKGKADIYEDYRKLLDRNDIDVVTISTPDHWHTKIAIDAMKAGKDIYCQKPLTLTIDEGKKICKVAQETGRVFQVGTQQRSDGRFQQAVVLAQSGRLGDIKKVTVAIGGAPEGGPFQKSAPPAHLNWDMWLGQTPLVDYIPKRCHYEFRWWYEYSGGKMTDWGAHHVDIAQWAIGMDRTGPTLIEPLMQRHPVELKDGHPTEDNRYNTATKFNVRCVFPNGVEMFVCDNAPDLGFDNGVMIEGTKGRIFVNRGKLTGAPVDALQDEPLPEDLLLGLRKGKSSEGHMANFITCVKDRSEPISDVVTHHRAMTTCHLANIAIRLNRSLNWDANQEQITGDDAANQWLAREQRKGYEIQA